MANPVMTGSIALSLLTTSSYTLSWPAATGDLPITGYELSLNGGSTWSDLGNVLTTNITGRTSGSTDSCRIRAYDSGAARSLAIARSVTLSLTQVVTEPLENSGGSLHLNASVKWTWFVNGRVGDMENKVALDGTGTTNATTGVLLIEGLPAGSGILVTSVWGANATLDSIHYQALTVV